MRSKQELIDNESARAEKHQKLGDSWVENVYFSNFLLVSSVVYPGIYLYNNGFEIPESLLEYEAFAGSVLTAVSFMFGLFWRSHSKFNVHHHLEMKKLYEKSIEIQKK